MAKLASDNLMEAYLYAVCKMKESDGQLSAGFMSAADQLILAQAEINGLPYFCTPQSEWTGNDAQGNYMGKIRSPHICNSTKIVDALKNDAKQPVQPTAPGQDT